MDALMKALGVEHAPERRQAIADALSEFVEALIYERTRSASAEDE